MKTPKQMINLIQNGLVDNIICQLKSGKEASVFIVLSEGEIRCAKVYKEANKRSFKKNDQYMEGRKCRNSRKSRAIEKRSKYGRKEQEKAWQNTEVEVLYRLAAAGVRVPKVFEFMDGVLIMELLQGQDGKPAPRLIDVELTPELAKEYYIKLIRDVVQMLCIGIIHGDLSEYNILLGCEGPVIIDLPQAVDASSNNQALEIFTHDLNNLKLYFSQFAPEISSTDYCLEIWDKYKKGILSPDCDLTGHFRIDERKVDIKQALEAVETAQEEELERRSFVPS
ncbi:MAG: PA4780 family RIO1-like protein kinase [Oligoflexales bacterium]